MKRTPVTLPVPDPRTGPVTAFDRSEHREKVAASLEQLSEDHREVLLHRYFEGLSAEEAGTRMGKSAGAVRKLTVRALAELGRKL